MPIDYSKFDRIDDSDEEGGQRATASSAGAGTVARPAGGPKASRGPAKGTNHLEPTGLDERLCIVAPGSADPLASLASELERLAGTGPRGPAPEAPRPGEPQRLCVRSGGRKKIHTNLPDGSEMVEEFDERTDILLLRKSRRPTKMGGEGEWVFEVGQAPEAAFDPHSDMLRASSSDPIFVRKDTPECLQWRIRNLPYAVDVYSVTVDHENQEIVVRTSNKKYFKRVEVPDLRRLGLKLKDELLTWKHQHSTLIISYARPAEVVAEEQRALREAEQAALNL